MGFRLLPRGIEESAFKPVPEGWLFTTSSPWVFAPRRTYLVSAAQKPAMAARVRRARYLRVAALLVELPLWILALSLLPLPSLARWGMILVASVGSGALFAIIDYLCVRSLIRDLPRSDRRIRLMDMWKTQSRSMSVRTLAIFTALEIAATLVMAGAAYAQRDVGSIVTTVLLLSFGLYFGALLLLKLRAEAASPQRGAR